MPGSCNNRFSQRSVISYHASVKVNKQNYVHMFFCSGIYSDIYVKMILIHIFLGKTMSEPQHEKPNKMTCASSEYTASASAQSNQNLRCPHNERFRALSAQRGLLSDWADAQADLSLRWAHMPFCCFCHSAAQFSSRDKLRERNFKFFFER